MLVEAHIVQFTITREQRDAICEVMMHRLTGIEAL